MKNARHLVSVAFGAVAALAFAAAHAQPVEELMNQGGALLQNGSYDQAASQFKRVLGRDPGNFEAQFNLAFCYLNMGRYPTAIQEFQKALGINRQCGECYGNLALAYEAQGNDEKALGAVSEAVRINPGNIEARMNLATMYANKGRLGDAISQYKAIIGIDGHNVAAHINLAKSLLSSGKVDEAKGYLKSALAINPNEAEAYWVTGNILWKNEGKKQDALSQYQKAVALQPNSQVYYENEALLLEDLDRKQDAIDVWRKYLVYLDDALKKEGIEGRIEKLERGEAPSGKESPEKLFGPSDRGQNIAELQSEMRGSEVKSSQPQMIGSRSANVENDLEDLDKKSGSEMDFDMKKAVKKKLEEKK